MKLAWCFIVVVISFSGYCQTTNQVSVISIETLQKQLSLNPKIQLVDVRTPKEYHLGYIANAVNIPISKRRKFKTSVVKTLDKNQPVFIYCHSGIRSNKAAKVLAKLGFSKIFDFSQGWNVWKVYTNPKL